MLKYTESELMSPSQIGESGYYSLFDYYLIFFISLPLISTTKIAVTGMMSDKLSRSLEPLLVTPLTSIELLVGKTLAAVIPATLASWLSYVVFAAVMSHTGIAQSPIFGRFGGSLWLSGIFVLAPLIAILMAVFAFLISSRMNDARNAENFCNQFAGGIAILILTGIGGASYFHYAVRFGLFAEIIGALILVNLIIVFFSTKLFQRETILFKWK